MRKLLLVLGCVLVLALAFACLGGCLLLFTPEVNLKELAREVEKANNLPPGTVKIEAKKPIKWVVVEVEFKKSPGRYNASLLTKENIRKCLESAGKKWFGAWLLVLSVPGGDLSDFFLARKYSFGDAWQRFRVKKEGAAPLVCKDNVKNIVPYFDMENWTSEDMMNFKTVFQGEWQEERPAGDGKGKMMHRMQTHINVDCDEVDWTVIAAYPKGVDWHFKDVDSFVNSKNVIPDLKACSFTECKKVNFPKGFRCERAIFHEENGRATYDSFLENVAPESLLHFTFNMKYSTFEDIRRFPNLKSVCVENAKDGIDWRILAEVCKGDSVTIRKSPITVKDIDLWIAEKKFNSLILSNCNVDSSARKKCEEIGATCIGDWSGFMFIHKKQ